MSSRRGITLIEAILFVSISLGLIVGGIVFYQQAASAARVNDQIRHFSSQFAEIRALYNATSWKNGTSDSRAVNDVLVSSGAVSEDMLAGALGELVGERYSDDAPTNFQSDTNAIWTTWRTPSYWVVVSDTRFYAMAYNSLLPIAGSFDPVTWANLVRVFEQGINSDNYTLQYTIMDLSETSCTRFLNSALNGTLTSLKPNVISGSNGAALAGPDFSVSDLSSFCAQVSQSDATWTMLSWQSVRL